MKLKIPNIFKLSRRGSSRRCNGDDSSLSVSFSTASSDISWDRLSPEKRQDLTVRGWTKKAWDKDDPSLMTFYNEVELDWEYLPEDRKKYWMDRGYDQNKWNNEESELHDCVTLKGNADATPTVLQLQLDDLCRFDLSYYEGLENRKIEVYSGNAKVSEENPIGSMGLKDYLSNIREGKTDFKFNTEDIDQDKALFSEVGSAITKNLHQALTASKLGEKGGLFKEEWQKMSPDDFNWSIWMGGKGTRTPMHFDSDLFNFLYVVEGKKRVVCIPYDHRTDGMFKIQEFYSGSAYTGIDVLDPDFDLPEGSVDVVLGPGEGLCIPHRWWHMVENQENTVAYGFRVME